MEYVVPLIIVLVIVLVVVAGSRVLGRRARSLQDRAQDTGAQDTSTRDTSTPGSPGTGAFGPGGRKSPKANREITRENAQAAGARLTAETHRRVYSLIAQHQVLSAVKEYRMATRLGLADSAAAVAALAQFPQPTPEPGPPNAVTPQRDAVAVPPAIKDGPLTVEDIMNAAPERAAQPSETFKSATMPVPAAGSYRYRAIVSRGDEVREVASTRLNESIFGQIRALALSGDHDGAAKLLRERTDIGETEALEFVRLIEPQDPQE